MVVVTLAADPWPSWILTFTNHHQTHKCTTSLHSHHSKSWRNDCTLWCNTLNQNQNPNVKTYQQQQLTHIWISDYKNNNKKSRSERDTTLGSNDWTHFQIPQERELYLYRVSLIDENVLTYLDHVNGLDNASGEHTRGTAIDERLHSSPDTNWCYFLLLRHLSLSFFWIVRNYLKRRERERRREMIHYHLVVVERKRTK